MKHIKLFESFSEESESSPIEDFYKKYYPSSLTASLDPNSQEAKDLLLYIDLNLGRLRSSDDTEFLQKKSGWGDIFPTYKEIWKTDDAELTKLVDNIYKNEIAAVKSIYNNKSDTQLNESFDLSNDKWRHWAISKNEELTYDDLDSHEKSLVDQISYFINNAYHSEFQEYNANKYSGSPSASFDKQDLTVKNGLNRKDIQNLSEYLDKEFGEKFITADASGSHFIKLEGIVGNYYKLLLNPLFIKKYKKEAADFYHQFSDSQ